MTVTIFPVGGTGGGPPTPPTPEAATFVVHPTPGTGDFTTVAAALAALPAEGGYILVREGTYALTVTNTMPDKPVVIRGCGDATVFTLGANAIAAFTIDDVLTARRQFTFSNLKVTGNSTANQRAVDVGDSNFLAQTVIDRVNTEGIKFPLEISGGGFSSADAVNVDVQDCWWVPVAAGNGSMVNPSGGSSTMHVTFWNVNFWDPTDETIGGFVNNDSFTALDVNFYNCTISWTTEDGLNSIYAERTRIFNYVGQGVAANANIIFIGALGADPNNVRPMTEFVGCNVVGMTLLFQDDASIEGGYFDTTSLDGSAVNGRITVEGVTFRCDASNVPQFPHFGTTPTAYIRGGSEFSVISCRFTNPGGLVERYIEAEDSFYIAYCAFASMAAGATHSGIHVTGPNTIVIGCDFDSNWAAPPIKEEGVNAIANVYSDNIGLNGNGGTDSVWVAPAATSPSTFNGSALFNRTNTTTDAFVLVKMTLASGGTSDPGIRINPRGLVGGGTIKNTGGANSMDVKETVTDFFGVTESVTTPVAFGVALVLKKMDAGPFGATAFPPYVSYKVEVKSTSAGNATTYSYAQNLNSEVTW